MAPKQGETTKFSSGKTRKNIMEKNYSHKKQRFYKILRGAFQNFWPPLPLPGSRDFQLMYFFSFPILLWYSGDWWALPCCFCGALIKSPCIFPSLNDNFCNYGKKNPNFSTPGGPFFSMVVMDLCGPLCYIRFIISLVGLTQPMARGRPSQHDRDIH